MKRFKTVQTRFWWAIFPTVCNVVEFVLRDVDPPDVDDDDDSDDEADDLWLLLLLAAVARENSDLLLPPLAMPLPSPGDSMPLTLCR